MSGEFISPNWHVVLIHYPIALLTIGVLVEIATAVARSRGPLRYTGRWMILAAALFMIPTATAGIYAFRDALHPDVSQVHPTPWAEVVAASPWSQVQWHFMDRHAWLTGSATVLVALAVFGWLAAPTRWRPTVYWPALLFLVVAAGLVSAGNWYSGEAVYRYGTAVKGLEAGEAGYGFPPVQMHVVMAGAVAAAALLALSLTLHELGERRGGAEPQPGAERPAGLPRGLWWAAAVLAFLTLGGGFVATAHSLAPEALLGSVTVLGEGPVRLWCHVLCGLTIVALPVVLALLLQSARGVWVAVGCVVLLLAIAGQVWLGILLLYDGHHGSLVAFDGASHHEKGGHGGDHQHARGDGKGQQAQDRAGEGQGQPSGDESPTQAPAAEPAATVGMTDGLEFAPATVTVAVGDTVRWRNDSSLPHTVTADPQEAVDKAHVQLPRGAETFASGRLQPGETFEHTFTVPGRYRYICVPHETKGMVGEVEVRPATGG